MALLSEEQLDGRLSPDLWPEPIDSEMALLSEEQLDGRLSPDLWPEPKLGSLTAAALLEKVKDLQNLAYKLGIEESREMTRGRFLDILRKDKEEEQETLVCNEDDKCLEWRLCIA
ncbi:hypothetical protein HPB51_011149 [Rhipicephalus microplus]|uniref:Protein lin-52 homolog n=1 Tax=Rhipicephalus microplus TaxID=6941 RepID=A0A9J6E046_RHIMP|nr:hypothetical protein HPB51_011149 [Rhipicephalus microplus]